MTVNALRFPGLSSLISAELSPDRALASADSRCRNSCGPKRAPAGVVAQIGDSNLLGRRTAASDLFDLKPNAPKEVAGPGGPSPQA